ncbi:nucleotide-binding protein [Sulfurimonas sp.]|uniref:nucleotide-binding protein n=1 Tax=Sulfurimonas sp. TaxID=2022749 RepID=UPI00286D915B|nr:nucleotide-binding protein [Sulfurimonas sp.]
MAKAKQQVEKIQSELKVSKDEAEQKLKDRIEEGKRFLEKPTTDYNELEKLFDKWNDFNNELLKRLFTSNEYQRAYMWSGDHVVAYNNFYGELSYSEKFASLKKNLIDKVDYLETLIEKLELIPVANSVVSKVASQNEIVKNKKVFIVHGRDELAKTCLETLLHEMGLETIVLHRQADEGQTVIEKFEKHSDVGYAFILLTPDEISYLADEDKLPDEERKKEKRARPNVIFEFGYFVGKLSRQRVCCLYTGGVTVPSDLNGFVYKQYDKSVEEVAYSIQKDLKAVGILQ